MIERIVKALPSEGVAFDATSDTVTVPAATDDGFAVALMVRKRAFQVWAEGWSEQFDRAEDAYDCFILLLSEHARLQVSLRGGTAVGWQIERRMFGLWVPGHPVRKRVVALWRPARTIWKQNHVFKSEPSS